MKPEILTVRRAYAVDIKTQDGACGERFLRGERGLALTTEQAIYSVGSRGPERSEPKSVKRSLQGHPKVGLTQD